MSSHAALAALILAAGFTGYGIMLALVYRADRAKAREREQARLEDAETAAEEMRLVA